MRNGGSRRNGLRHAHDGGARMSGQEPRKLTAKQWAFVREYLVDCNGTQAAIRAGYSPKTANEQASRMLANVNIRAAVEEGQKMLARQTETEAEWVRRRLKEEADDHSEFATHAGRIRALELVGKINGVFEMDNKQKIDPLLELLRALPGKVMGVAKDGGEDD